MSLNPSNAISEQMTGKKPFPNVAGLGERDPAGVDAILAAELEAAGIEVGKLPECMRAGNGEPQSVVLGQLYKWGFRRAWYYWIAEGPGIPPSYADKLHETHGREVRVNGHCGCPSPREQFKGFAVGLYHVDTQDGLHALADTIRQVVRDSEQKGTA